MPAFFTVNPPAIGGIQWPPLPPVVSGGTDAFALGSSGAPATLLNAGGSLVDWKDVPVTVQAFNSGAAWDYAEVLSVTRSTGLMPGKAIISVRNVSAVDETGPITLGADTGSTFAPNMVKYWSRIKILQNAQTLFVGALMKRRDVIGGNTIILEYWDDRWLLSKIRLRGAVCYDPLNTLSSGAVKLIPRLDPHVNPKGYRNCTKIANSGDDVYVFLAPADWGTQTKEYDPTDVESSDVTPGTALPWTPERWLKYLRYVCCVFDPTVGNTNGYANSWTSLDTTKLAWNVPSFQDGTMRGKMPEKNFRGETVLKAIGMTLAMTGEYDLGVDYSNNTLRYTITTLGQKNVNTAGATAGKTIYLQRAGAIADNKGVFDGVAETDASELCTGVLVEGAPYRIEAQFWYSNGNVVDPDTGLNDSLKVASSIFDDAQFLKIIRTGKDLNGNDIPGGSNGSAANTVQAMNVARTCFPKPFRALQIDSSANSGTLTIMKGLNNVLAAFPYLQTFRPVMHEQLQPYYESGITTARGRLRIQIRIQVSDVDSSTSLGNNPSKHFRDVAFNNGLRITPDGLIWLDGLTDDLAGVDNLYTNTLKGYTGVLTNGVDTTAPLYKYIKLNLAIEHDARMFNCQDIFSTGVDWNDVADQIDGSLNGFTGVSVPRGPRLGHYALNPEGFIVEHQVKSYPALPGSFQTTDGGSPPTLKTLSIPCNKIIYDDTINSLPNFASRALQKVARFKRTAELRLPGIRADLDAGDYFDRVLFVNGAGGEYKLNAPGDSIEYDLRKRETILRFQ